MDIVERMRQPAALLTIEDGTKLLSEARHAIELYRAALRKIANDPDTNVEAVAYARCILACHL